MGDRVLTTDQSLPSEPEPAPGTWRHVALKMANPESKGDIIDIEVLRPLAWIESVRATEGATILFGLPEMGLKGPATVVSVSDCPAIKPPPGRVVLGTVSHLNGYVYELRFDGHDEPLYPTRRHRLFSVDRDSWVQTGDLRIGEKLKTIGGNATIRSVRKYPGVHRVHNLDIQTDDCYYVGHVEALSHNDNTCARAAKSRGLWKVERFDKSVMWRNKRIKRDPDTKLWWSRDMAKHGESEWKVFEETERGLAHFADADKYGDFIIGKHKGPVGQFIPWSQTH